MSPWKQKIEYDVSQNDEDDDDVEIEESVDEVDDTGYERYNFCQDQILTIGSCGEFSFYRFISRKKIFEWLFMLLGYPNVGKSSIINGLMGKKVSHHLVKLIVFNNININLIQCK